MYATVRVMSLASASSARTRYGFWSSAGDPCTTTGRFCNHAPPQPSCPTLLSPHQRRGREGRLIGAELPGLIRAPTMSNPNRERALRRPLTGEGSSFWF